MKTNAALDEQRSKLLYKVEEAAERLSLSRAYLFKLIRDGRIRAIKIGGATRIAASELERYVSEL